MPSFTLVTLLLYQRKTVQVAHVGCYQVLPKNEGPCIYTLNVRSCLG